MYNIFDKYIHTHLCVIVCKKVRVCNALFNKYPDTFSSVNSFVGSFNIFLHNAFLGFSILFARYSYDNAFHNFLRPFYLYYMHSPTICRTLFLRANISENDTGVYPFDGLSP